jgi:hypothetical protein
MLPWFPGEDKVSLAANTPRLNRWLAAGLIKSIINGNYPDRGKIKKFSIPVIDDPGRSPPTLEPESQGHPQGN